MDLRLEQFPAPGERRVQFVGDRLRFTLRDQQGRPFPPGWRARLRTNLGRARVLREEIITAVESHRPPTLCSWRDIPMAWEDGAWSVEMPLAEVGWFRAKAYALDERGWQHWPDGPDFGVSVQPAWTRTGNTIYCAFPRMFGPSKTAQTTTPAPLDAQLVTLDQQGFTVIPPSGKFRDLIRELPHIFDTLGCRILHLLPVNPTPTTYARFGRFGSPYACEDLLAVDPALVEFDQRTTGVDQFRELAHAVHARGGRLFLDLVVNHTGWGSTLHETHPEWFVRHPDGKFASPGAWGTVWEDLVELDHHHEALRRELGEAIVEWCRRGVDGFRCDAGYKVPLPVWEYIIARVRQEFPDTVFLLEGLGGSWEATETLLSAGGMQWAYSELFQNYTGAEVARYLDYALRQSERVGLYVHYSETHDNPRLAEQGRAWALLRNRLCALTSVSGAFGFTCGVEWLATERVNVHSSRGLAWGAAPNLIPELARLNQLLAEHPCFFDGARLTRLSSTESPVLALLRESAESRDAVLVLANTDLQGAHEVELDRARLERAGLPFAAGGHPTPVDLLGGDLPGCTLPSPGRVRIAVPAGACFALAPAAAPQGPRGHEYRRRRALEAFALAALSHHLPAEQIDGVDLCELADWVDTDPAGFLSAATGLAPDQPAAGLTRQLAAAKHAYPRVVRWGLADRHRITPVPPRHWLLVTSDVPFRARLRLGEADQAAYVESTAVRQGHVAALPAPASGSDAELALERFGGDPVHVSAAIRFLAESPSTAPDPRHSGPDTLALLTNGRGAMARLHADFGAIRSKYDCLLGANLHATVPVDRHIFAKRARAWVNADGFLSPLDADNLARFRAGAQAHWSFLANAGDGRGVAIEVTAAMLPDLNAVVLHFQRPLRTPDSAQPLPPEADVRLTVRVDIEDRGYHGETKHNAGTAHHFASHTASRADGTGFDFAPAADRRLQVWATTGQYHPQAEWCFNLGHPVEASRGMEASGDAFSPGWFELPLRAGEATEIILSAEARPPTSDQIVAALAAPAAPPADFAHRLAEAASAFVVRRDDVRTVIAGYPWFLDWGRDTLIAARGLLAAGRRDEVLAILKAFGRFESDGTLPNSIYGENATNRDTSDAPLWFGVVCEEAAVGGDLAALAGLKVDAQGRTLGEVLRSIAAGYLHGTPNGIRVDAASGLVFSPSHFTWMDTNHPAGTPREGYPVEIQALWIRLLRLLARLGAKAEGEPWSVLAERAAASFAKLFWLEAKGWFADVLLAKPGQAATEAVPSDALRSNCLLAVCLGIVTGEPARRTVEACRQWLVVPGALRSLAPLPVAPPLPVHSPDGRLLNDPANPYWGRYEGDEDTRRKPAYHNGTAWGWTFPHFCEALARAWDFSPAAVAAARAYLGSVDRLLGEGCLGQLPEILDGDAPHTQRGCDAQAWSVTEALRVWRLLESPPSGASSGAAGAR